MDVIAKECKDSKESSKKERNKKKTFRIKEKYTIQRVASSR